MLLWFDIFVYEATHCGVSSFVLATVVDGAVVSATLFDSDLTNVCAHPANVTSVAAHKPIFIVLEKFFIDISSHFPSNPIF